MRSLPSLGAWIETVYMTNDAETWMRRSLHWERGLKQKAIAENTGKSESLPSLGAWIETHYSIAKIQAWYVAPFIGSVD